MKNQKPARVYFALSLITAAILACRQFIPAPSPTPQVTATRAVSAATLHVSTDPNAGSAGLNDSLYPGFGNGGYDVQHYTLDITINDVKTSDMTAATTIEAVATQDLSSFNLDFVGFDITEITVNDKPADFKRAGQELTIMPSQLIADKDPFSVIVQYSGQPQPMPSVALPVQTGWVTFGGGSFVLSEPDGAASFYPVNDHPLDKAAYTYRVTVPEPFEVAANGLLTNTLDHGDTKTYLFEAREPMASYLATIEIGRFRIENLKSKAGIPLRNYYSIDLPADISKPFARQGEMLDYFSQIFGPYPFDVYGALVINIKVGAALENQTMSVFGIDMIDLQDIQTAEYVVAHELAHQWFGDSLSVADWGDIWLNEGFATYAEALWAEHTQGRRGLDGYIRYRYIGVIEHPESSPPPGNPPANDLFNNGVYARGGLTLHALRIEVGDKAFFEILRKYYDRYQGGNASTEDFIAVAEEVSGRDLNGLFDKWLYQDALPPITELGLGNAQ